MKLEFGEWIYDGWMTVNSMHICFYEGWCSREDVEDAIKRLEKLLNKVEERNKRKES